MLDASDFIWDEFCWKGRVRSPTGSDGGRSVELVFAPEGRGDGPLNEEELTLLRWVESRLEDLVAVAEQAVLDAQVPPPGSEDLRLSLTSVNVHPLYVGGVPYVGLEFASALDAEHGAGVLLHGTRVVEAGGADTAILLWIAKRDAASAT